MPLVEISGLSIIKPMTVKRLASEYPAFEIATIEPGTVKLETIIKEGIYPQQDVYPQQSISQRESLSQDEKYGSLYRILIHNDDVTPFDYVIHLLKRIFLLSDEIAEHIAITAHDNGVAVVLVRPLSEAKKLIGLAHSQARLDDYPLTFSLEPNT